jgi:ATP-dependent DNA ligase
MTGLNLPVRVPLKPMLAKAVSGIPQPADAAGGLAYEPKWDGFRCIVSRDGAGIELSSRGERPLTRYFPELAAGLLRELPTRCVVDGEIVIRNGPRLDFDALTERIHPAASRIKQLAARTPASFIVFDLLALDEEALLAQPFGKRREMLTEALRGCCPPVHVTPLTLSSELAARWFEEFEGAGLDGVVAKPLAGDHQPGKRAMFKIKHERTADCVVAGFRWHKSGDGVGSLLLGLYDDGGRLHHVGVASSFPAKYRAQLTEELRPLRMTAVTGHPWADWAEWADPGGPPATPAEPPATPAAQAGSGEPGNPGIARMPGGQSRWTGARDLSWEPLRPELIAEVAYDHLQSGRFRHTGQLRRWRPDRDPASCTFSQLEEPVAYDLDHILGDHHPPAARRPPAAHGSTGAQSLPACSIRAARGASALRALRYRR